MAKNEEQALYDKAIKDSLREEIKLKHWYDFMFCFDIENGNPNGDPNTNNSPRIIPDTNFGLVTDVCQKRKIRNYVDTLKKYITEQYKKYDLSYEIYVREKAILNKVQEEAYVANGIPIRDKDGKIIKANSQDVDIVRAFMCDKYFDIRTFGAVMSTQVNCGQVRGPVQINFAKSIDIINPIRVSITRMAVTTEKEANDQNGDNRTIGQKHIIPYALYRTEGYISPFLAEQTGFNECDLEVLWQSLLDMFDYDHSASRGKMSARKLIIFKHTGKFRKIPSHKLFDTIKINRIDNTKQPTKFEDYEIKFDKEVDDSVEVIERL